MNKLFVITTAAFVALSSIAFAAERAPYAGNDKRETHADQLAQRNGTASSSGTHGPGQQR